MATISLLKEKGRPTSTLAAILFLSLLMAGRLVVQIRLYQQGFISVSADEFARGLRALTWSQAPRISPAADLISPWPPFEMYLNGTVLLIIDDVLLAPRLTVFLASCLLLVALFLLTDYLFNRITAVLTVIMVAVQPWVIWLSGTPMLEMYFLACFISGVYAIIIWLDQQRRFYWIGAGLFFFLASGLHVQSWMLINLVNLFTLPYFYQFIQQRNYKQAAQLFGFWLLGNSYIIFWGVAEYAMTGQLFGILASHTSYSLWFYDGYNVATSEKLLYFPRIVWHNFPPLLWLWGGAGLFFILRGSALSRRLFLLALGSLTLLTASIFNLASGPPSAAPDRYVLLYVLLFSPYAAYGLFRLGKWTMQANRRPVAYLGTGLLAVLLAVMVGHGLQQTAVFPQGVSPNTIQTGRYLHNILTADETDTRLSANQTIMVEALYWDFLALELLTRQSQQLIYDREHDYLNRDNPSLFEADTAVIHSHLSQTDVALIVLRNPSLQEKAASLSYLTPHQQIGSWAVFRFVDATP